MMLRVLLVLALMAVSSQAAHAQSLETVLMPGQVIQGHARYEEDCKCCHVRWDKSAQDRLCLDCHKEVAQDLKAVRGFHGRLKEHECRSCHTDHKGRGFDIAPLDKQRFDHGQTDFRLRDGHALGATVKCESCHKPKLKYRAAPSECSACHGKDDVHKGSLSAVCATCHSERDWKDARFDHDKTRFRLGGKHADAACKDCHRTQEYKGAPRECNGCHRKDDDSKGHKGRYGTKCESCHGDRDWKEIRFSHDRDTQYMLRGKHRQVKCDSCHKGVLHREHLSRSCIGCHREDDVHKGGLGEKCETCHSERDWVTSTFNHDKDTKFALRDKHRTAKCESCHKRGNYREKLETSCVACHRSDDERKAHKGRFGPKCETCHTEKDWKTILFDHGRDTKYPLRGRHDRVKCGDCHKGTLYQESFDTACVACHRKDDVHKDRLGSKCETCHSEKDWKDAPFDHNRSRFPLLGAHFKVECRACHKTKEYRDTPLDCLACHDKDDAHKRRLGIKCANCHNARSWKAWDFDHDRRTDFKLDGGHKGIACLNCHKRPVSGDRLALAATCVGCHADADVHHGGFGVQCERCHLSTKWRALRSGNAQGVP